MFSSLRARILLTLSCILLLSGGTISYFAQTNVQRTAFESANQHSVDLMNAVLLSVENEYRSLQFHQHNTIERRKNQLKDLAFIAMSHLTELQQEVERGLLSEADARQEALDQLRQLRYADGVGYFWVNDLARPIPQVLMHPILPAQDVDRSRTDKFIEATSGQGHLLVAIANIIDKDGEGFIEYLWNKPTATGITPNQRKLSYVRLFEPWGWVVGTGVYLDDIDAEIKQRLDEILIELKRTFSRVHVAENGYMFVFNSQGDMLIHPDDQGEFATEEKTLSVMAEQFMAAAKYPDVPLDYLGGHPGLPGQHHHKRAYVSYFEPLDWYIASTMYLDEITQPGRQLRAEILFVSALALFGAAVLAYLFATSLARPVRLLSKAALEIERTQDLQIKVPVCGPRETRELGTVLQRMLESMTLLIHDKELALCALETSNDNLLTTNKKLAQEMDERRDIQHILEVNEQKYRALFEFSSDAILLVDRETLHVIDSNKTAEDLFGYSHNEMQGKVPQEFSPPLQADGQETAVKVKQRIERLKDGPQFFEWTHQRVNGSLFLAEVQLTPITLDDKPLILSVIRDVTQRKKAEGALVNALSEAESSRDKIDAILKAISDGLMVIDHIGRIILINAAAQQWLNLPEGDTLNQTITAVLHNNDLSQLICSTLTGNSLVRRCEIEVPVRGYNRKRLLAVQVTAVQSDDNAVSGTLVLLRDITRERELDRLKNEFISTAAHELNTPLTAIMGFAELLVNQDYRQSINPDQQQEFLETIHQKGEVLTSIVDDLLKLEQLEFGQAISLQKHYFDLQTDLIALVARYKKKWSGYHFTIEADPCELWADREKICQVIDNILSNAVKFSPSHTHIHIVSKVVDDYVEITVHDEGIGMEAQHLGKVFDKFFRIDASTTSKGGLGLGLTVAKSIVDAHFGSIRVDSRLDQGTTVTVKIPRQGGEERYV